MSTTPETPAVAAAATAPVAPVTGGEEAPKLSKAQLNKLAAKAKKEERKAAGKERQDSQKAAAAQAAAAVGPEPGAENFQKLPINMSQKQPDPSKQWVRIRELTAATHDGKQVVLQARVHTVRAKGNVAFLLLRQSFSSVQAVVEKGELVPKSAIKFVGSLTPESLVEVTGLVCKATVDKATQHDVELHITKCFVVSEALTPLPLQIEDAARPSPVYKEMKRELAELDAKLAELMKDKSEEDKAKSPLKEQIAEIEAARRKCNFVKPSQDTRLNNRVIDLRTPANQAIFRLQSAACQLFREFLLERNFVEIHTPKLIGCASEGGSNIFQVKYFDRAAFLAQSPQLYKQMAITADLERVFEIGPVFRAEQSFTRRHLTEFVGLDIEMAFREHYHEVLTVIEGLFSYIMEGLTKRWSAEIAAVSLQYPVKPVVASPVIRIAFPEAIAMLRADGQTIGDFDDFSTPLEIRLGELVAAKYHTDLYVIDKFPEAVRPFYTMPDPQMPGYSNSYDAFLRGQEICSGAQRIHDPAMLTERAMAKGVAPKTIQPYIDSFKWGAPPHAGAGIGLERIVMLFLGLGNIRKTSMFPRDPARLDP